ncbi:MAG: glutathione S-transferase N-terminal domain-containing protein [Pseudomonadota bacterium]
MTSLADHPVAGLRPAQHPDRIQLYSFPTPNGIKVSALLEETGLPYEAHTISIMRDDQLTPEFIALNPNNKIPAIIDPNGPDGALPIFESGAILIYLAEKAGQFLPSDPVKKADVLQWLMWQMGGLGPMTGQLGFFWKFAGKEIEDKRPQERYLNETKRLLGVLDRHLAGKDFVAAGEYTIADMAIWPWIRALDFYGATEAVGLAEHKNITRWYEACLARPASQRALNIPDRNG